MIALYFSFAKNIVLNNYVKLFLLIVSVYFWSCKPETFTDNTNDKLVFSHDTIIFDTIISQLYKGTPKSVNRQFVVKNKHNKSIKTSIKLANGNLSTFSLNVDGEPGIQFDNIVIKPNDSIFVFVEAYANPNHNPLGNPLILRDSIVFLTNNNLQNIQLVAWGQDANFFLSDSVSTNSVWSDKTKPYVIYDFFKVKEGATLTIKEGVKVYFSPYSAMWVQGTLKVEGTNTEPVIFEGDRTSDKYSDKHTFTKYYNIPGQWFGIYLQYPSKSNTIKYARIKNATVGVYMDSSSFDGNANVSIYNTFIQNMTYSAVRGTRSKVYIENSVLANCGSACLYTFKGGDYNLKHITVSGYCDFGSSNDPALAVTNRLRNQFGQILETYSIAFSIINSIVWGELKEEVMLDIDEAKLISLSPLNSLFKTTNGTLSQTITENVLNKEPKFKDYTKYNFDLDTLSHAKDIGKTLTPQINIDYMNRLRDSKPDAGAFERIE